MRLVSFQSPYGVRLGALEPGGVLDLQAAEVLRLRRSEGRPLSEAIRLAEAAVPHDMLAFLAAGRPAMEAARRTLAAAAALPDGAAPWYPSGTPLAPVVPRPGKLIVLRGNYRRHRAEMAPRLGTKLERPDRPRYFLKAPTSVLGDGGEIVYPEVSHEVHHEVELAAVIGAPTRGVRAEDALAQVAGYTILLDITARDLSGRDDRNKSFDTFGPLGACIAPADEVPDPHSLAVSLRVNGEQRQQGTTADMEFQIHEIIAFLSEAMTLEPGDVIATGTPEGVGPIEVGDELHAEIEGVGSLRCRVAAPGVMRP
jgi:acylpyruvate hydrolase